MEQSADAVPAGFCVIKALFDVGTVGEKGGSARCVGDVLMEEVFGQGALVGQEEGLEFANIPEFASVR